ncbi:MAG TPA: universal stress protein [Nitrososphaeraceae archaeon]|nr:universal stress protein [Nitrososphaeraceae archaeon]
MAGTILVPHDGHSMSDKALEYGIDIAKAMNMRIKIIRVIEEGVAVSTMPQLRDVERRRIRKDLEQQLAEAREREYNKLKKQLATANSKGVEASASVLEGDVAQKLISIISEERPYIVVIGSMRLQARGLSKLKILGSVARKLSEESKCPVMIVR